MMFSAIRLVMAVLAIGQVEDKQPLLTYAGDGLTVAIFELSEDTGDVSGTIQRGADSWPFTGKISEDDGAEIVQGSFTAGKQKFAFTSRQAEGSDVIHFTTGNKTYKLKSVEAAEPPKKEMPANPLEAEEKEPAPAKQQADLPAALPEAMRLKLHVFPDVSMGVSAAYVVTLPEGWTSKGNIEWSAGELSYPQPKFEIVSPKSGRVRFIPAITLSYTESKGLAIPPQGIRPPQNFPQWFVGAVQQTNKSVSNVKLVSSRRDEKPRRFTRRSPAKPAPTTPA
jgi:hypothetical protein